MSVKFRKYNNLEEKVDSYLSYDPLYIDKVILYLNKLKELKSDVKNLSVKEFELLIDDISYYSAVLKYILTKKSQEVTLEEAFNEADKEAQNRKS